MRSCHEVENFDIAAPSQMLEDNFSSDLTGCADMLTCVILVAPTGIFGVPLSTSIKYAYVEISLTDQDGKQFSYCYVPIVVAKCGVFLKEKGEYAFVEI